MRRWIPGVLGTIVVVASVVAGPPAHARGPDDGYVGCSDSDDCVPFNLTDYVSAEPIELLPEGDLPADATMKPDGTEVWICGGHGDGVVIIDTATNTVIHRLLVGDYPTSVCFTDDSRLALVASRGDDSVVLIDTNTYRVLSSLSVLSGSGGTYDGPGQLALDPVSKKIYAVDWFGPSIYEIARDASEVTRAAQVGVNLWQLVVDPLGRYIYVTDRGTDQVRVIDQATLTEITAIDVSDDPWGIDVTRDGTKLVVPCEDHSNLFIIDTNDWSTQALPIQLHADPRDVDILDSADLAYIAGGKLQTGADTYVYVLDLATNQLIWQFALTGANANVIAVQGQMTSALTDVPDGGQTPSGLALSCRPNPFNPRTSIEYVLPEPGRVRLAVHDPAGRLVAELETGWREAGVHIATWDGRTTRGEPASSGVYFVRLEAAGERRSVKSVLLK